MRRVERRHFLEVFFLNRFFQQARDVFAIAAGNVTRSGVVGGYGKMIEIDHGNGLVSRSAHLSATDLAVGDVVSAGSIIGHSGQTGRVTGPHLHFEVRLKGVAIDPLLLAGWRSAP